jgi:hypothetical protein
VLDPRASLRSERNDCGLVRPRSGGSVSTGIDPSPQNDSATVATTVTGASPVNTTLPAVHGKFLEGATLTASTGTWTNAPTSFAYRWKSCTTGDVSSCTPIEGATKSSYVIDDGLAGDSIRVTVTATNATGSASATSGDVPRVRPAVTGAFGSVETNGIEVNVLYICRIPGTANINLGCVLIFDLTGAVPSGKAIAAKAKPIVLGHKKVRLKAGKKKKITIKLNHTGRKLLAKHRKLRATLTITEKHGRTRHRTITFRAPKKHKR